MVSDFDVDDVFFIVFSLIFGSVFELEVVKILFLRFFKLFRFMLSIFMERRFNGEFLGDFKIRVLGSLIILIRDLLKKFKFLGFE